MDRTENHGIVVDGRLHNSGAIAVGAGANAAVHEPAAGAPRPAPAAAPRVFVNYRSADEPGTALLLKRELSQRFGADNVFIDSGMIPPGADFAATLLRQVRRADALLVVVGPRWLTTTHPTGGRAIDHPDDWVRREIAAAFATGVPVVPVLVNAAPRLTGAPLPDDIAALATRQYLTLRHDSADADLARIADRLATHLPRP